MINKIEILKDISKKYEIENLNLLGIFAGIMSAITYAMLPIFNKNAS